MKTTRLLAALFAYGAVALLPTRPYAQNAVDFAAALELARKNNPDWRAAEQELEIARGKLTTARLISPFNPTIADGYHARADGLTSLAVVFGAIGVWLGYPLADPIVGLFITVAIFRIVLESGKSVFMRLLDGVDPEVVREIKHAVNHTAGVRDVTDVRVRWSGHWLHAEVSVAVSPELSIEKGHEIAKEVRHQLLHQLRYLYNATIHIDPVTASGEDHHGFAEHAHGALPAHSHR
jgi:hypothetical protein